MMMGGMLHGERDYDGIRLLTRHATLGLLAVSAAFTALLVVWPQSVLLLYGIEDIRAFWSGDLRFLRSF